LTEEPNHLETTLSPPPLPRTVMTMYLK
jgi:hypothetical protein